MLSSSIDLKTERLHLREIEEADFDAILAFHQDPRYLQYYPEGDRTVEETRTLVYQFVSWRQTHPRSKFQLAIIERKSGKLIGNCGIRKKEKRSRSAEFGIELNPEYWHQGYGIEAARSIIEWALKELDITDVRANCLLENTAIIKLLESIGFTEVGGTRQETHFKGEWHQFAVFILHRKHWPRLYP